MSLLFPQVHVFKSPEAETSLSRLGFCPRFQVAAAPPQGISLATQVHGTTILSADRHDPSSQHNYLLDEQGKLATGDGVYRTTPGRIGVQTGDCLPILLASEGHSFVMALHAGWRSLTGGIIQEAGRIWQGLGIDPRRLAVVLGPYICQHHFEVGPEVVEALHAPLRGLNQEECALCVAPGRGDRSHIDLGRAALLMLLRLGVMPERCSLMESCTFEHAEVWPSWRRDAHLQRRIWSTI